MGDFDYDDYGDIYSDYDFSPDLEEFLPFQGLGGLDYAGGEFAYKDLDFAGNVLNDPELFAAFAEANPEDAALLRDLMGGDYGFAPVGADNPVDAASGVYDPNDQSAAETARLQRQAGNEGDGNLRATGVPVGDPNDSTGTKKLGIDTDKKGILGTGISGTDALKYAAMLAAAKMAYDDAKDAREAAKGKSFKSSSGYQAVTGAGGVTGFKKAAMGGGIGSLEMARGGRALPPRYLKGHSDGMADKVPAHIDGKRPAALSDGEFVIPADVVSHLGNGNSNAGAKRLYEMMDRIRAARTGNRKQGKQINPDKFMPR